ncbi:MAG: Molybdenum cofactor cytidylyltransferase [Saprospiraceae bacterium]|nr:Molybdenum cofactor cytidylyltransferase [Saprospiraceae bacterium]
MSQRMGGENKLLLPFDGKTMLETTLDHILASGTKEIIVVTGYESDKIREVLRNYPVKVVHNPRYAAGMTSSIQAGIRSASHGTDGFMICLSDMPLIAPEIYRNLATVFTEKRQTEERTIVQPFFENTPGNPVIFSSFYKNELLALDYPEGCKPVVQANRQFVVRVDTGTDAILQDADTPRDFEKIKNLKV